MNVRLILGVAIGLLLLIVIALAVLSLTSKKPKSLGLTNGRLRGCPLSPNCVNSLAEDQHKRVAPLDSGTAPDPMVAVARAISEMPQAEIISQTDNYLHAEFTSTLFRFVDDVEVHFDGNEQKLHVRSASRAGYWDVGVNRRRVDAIRLRMSGPATRNDID